MADVFAHRSKLLVTLAGLLASLVAGALTTMERGPALVAAGVLAAAVAVLTVRARGVVIGGLVLAILDVVPGVSMTPARADLAVVALAGLLAIGVFTRAPGEPAPPGARLAAIWATVFVGWWLLTVVRSVVWGAVTPLHALLYGRDFLAYAVLLPLALWGLRRQDVRPALMTIGAGGALAVLSHIGIAAAGLPLEGVVHPTAIGHDGPLPRIYSSSNDLVLAVLPVALGAALLAPSAAARWTGIAVAMPAAIAVALLQIRAAYGALLLAIVLVTAAWALRSTRLAAILRWRLATALTALVLALGGLAVAAPAVFSDASFGVVSTRALSGLTDVRERTGTVGYRQQVAGAMFDRLGGALPVGLGFLHPDDRFFSDIPGGTIRNTDVGVMNILMTMGLVGAVLLYAPLVIAVVWLVRAAGRSGGDHAWLSYGMAIWLAAALLGSITLVTLFSQAGLVLTALLVALTIRATTPVQAP